MTPLTRRQLFTILPAGAAGCLGCFGRCAAQTAAGARALRAGEKADMTWEEIFKFAYGGPIPTFLKLADQIGRKRFVEMLQNAAAAAATEGMAKDPTPAAKRTLAAWMAWSNEPSGMFQHVLVYDKVRDEPAVVEVRVTQCLWAKTFRAAGAADIGYACICHPDFAAASGWNPKLKLIRTKTLMQGDEYCNHRFVMEST